MDIAIRLDSSDGQPGLVTRKLMRFLWIICVPPGYLESTSEFASPADLTRRHQIGFRDAGLGLFMMCQFTDPDGGSSVQDVPRDRLVVDDMTTI